MDFFPISLKLQQQTCLLVGGGQVAYRKAQLLIQAGARVTVIAPDIDAELNKLLQVNHGRYIATTFNEAIEQGLNLTTYRLVITATNDTHINQHVYHCCEALNILVNTVDETQHCRFMVPAIVDRSPLMISIATNGTSPVLARQLRTQLESTIPQ